MGVRTTKKAHYRRAVGGYIYFILCPANGYVKIGYSSHPPDPRFDVCRRVSPFPVVPMGYYSGWIAEERRLHARFKADWSHGEWFRSSPELLHHIATMSKPWTTPQAVVAPPFPTRERPLSDLKWAQTTYLKFRGEYRTVATWRMDTGCRRSLKSMRIMLNRAADPQLVLYPFIAV